MLVLNYLVFQVILSACSNFFRKILLRQSMRAHPNPMIYLRGISAKDLTHLLDFMYHGEVNVDQDELDNFLQVHYISLTLQTCNRSTWRGP